MPERAENRARQKLSFLTQRASLAAILWLMLAPRPWADEALPQEQGRDLVMSRAKGNCLACHAIADGELAGNIGPPLLAMPQRFPDRRNLFSQIWDATERNPDSRMPPFGKHGLLSEAEIQLIIDYLYTL